jgi:D-alanine-D-alanine ligase-like ATP-grasp enzyme
LPYIGWDIVVTENNFVVIEGNTKPGIESMQILAPLLEKERNREIMRRISDRM